ncbi:MAG TPA: POTRA domain-containing protein, partial [Thermoanaerobaculia bacterium]|nr:POTRA domain-containing protein [Thermoanaerobaculia bacterium]
LYRIQKGEQARVARALFDGETAPFSAEELLREARLRPGARYTEAKARADAGRMTEYLHSKGRLKGSIELIGAEPTDDGRVMPIYRVVVGPRVLFETRGVSAKKVGREVHERIEGQIFDEDLILQYVEEIRRQLQRKGHYQAKVDYALAQAPDTTTVTVTVEVGPRCAVERIVLTGNNSVPSSRLSKLMVTRKRGLPVVSPGRLVDEDLSGDVSAILGYYQTRGWIHAKVDKPGVTQGSKLGRLVVTISIEEGPRTYVKTRDVVGAAHVSPAEVETILRVKPGQPFSPNDERQDVYALQQYYHEHGWSEASVSDEYRLSSDRTAVDVTYRVEEGLRSFFGKAILRGNSRTAAARIRRLVTWREGSPFSETHLLETQRGLTRTGVFGRVELHPRPPDPESRARPVEVDLQEGRPLSILYGVGYQYAPDAATAQNDPYGVGGVSYSNLFGTMRSAGIEGQIAISGRFRLQLNYRDPFLLQRDYVHTAYLFATREPIQDLEIERFGLVNEVSHLYGSLRVALRAEYQRIRPVNPQDLSVIEMLNFPRFDRPIEEATIGPILFYERRDEIIDPHKGFYLSTGFKYAFPFLNAVARYGKLSAAAATYLPVGKSVIAIAGRAGGIFPYGPADIQVPIAERFFVGGRSTNRAFDTDVLGIPGETVDTSTRATPHPPGAGSGSCAGLYPTLLNYDCAAGPRIVGSNGFLALNAELRFPIFGNLGGTIFYDAAQVWKNASGIRLAFEGSDGLRQGAGIGLRYMTPVGPLRAEYGWPVKARTILFDVVTTDATGHPTCGPSLPTACLQGTTKERGRFFFSIGYPF